mmetsp:Transcript_124302/g.202055  ORF Transcript_124302/g.202055 Transcript_124302/m.202055 type:complete len:224 (+) Transcript_124302:122-793(+)
MPTYKLNYFSLTALGEPIRTSFVLAGIPLEDEPLEWDAWCELKAKCPPGTGMPVLHMTEGETTQMMFQSRAILRYIGTIGSYDGCKLYPDDPMARYYCDLVIEMMEDIRGTMTPSFSMEPADRDAMRADLVKPDGKMYPHLSKLNEHLGKFPWSAGDKPSIADAYAVSLCFCYQQPTVFDGFPEDTFKDFPNITALKDKYCSLPPIKEYYKDAEGMRAPFKMA